jgi:predicted phosphodiesterase
VWRKRRGNVALQNCDERMQEIETSREEQSSRTLVNPGTLSFPRGPNAVHTTVHVHDARGETAYFE